MPKIKSGMDRGKDPATGPWGPGAITTTTSASPTSDAHGRRWLNGRPHLDGSTGAHHDAYMRTTLTLDDDLAAKLKDFARRKRLSFKDAINSILRRGLTAQDVSRRAAKPFRVHTFRSPLRAGVDPLKLNQLADELEAQHFERARAR